jgi:hypothetical protein
MLEAQCNTMSKTIEHLGNAIVIVLVGFARFDFTSSRIDDWKSFPHFETGVQGSKAQEALRASQSTNQCHSRRSHPLSGRSSPVDEESITVTSPNSNRSLLTSHIRNSQERKFPWMRTMRFRPDKPVSSSPSTAGARTEEWDNKKSKFSGVDSESVPKFSGADANCKSDSVGTICSIGH